MLIKLGSIDQTIMSNREGTNTSLKNPNKNKSNMSIDFLNNSDDSQ